MAPAYKTLTNDIARENFEKYGHPDGRQSTKLGVALPEELFGRGRFEGLAPFVLLDGFGDDFVAVDCYCEDLDEGR